MNHSRPRKGRLGIATPTRGSQVQRPLDRLTRWSEGGDASQRNKLAVFAASEQPDGPYKPYEKNHLFLHYACRRASLLRLLHEEERDNVIHQFDEYQLDHG